MLPWRALFTIGVALALCSCGASRPPGSDGGTDAGGDSLDPPDADEQHPGRPRRWYALTPEGRGFLTEEARRMGALADRATRILRTGEP